MFRTEPMYKLRILCLENEAGKVIELLHKLNTIELRRSKLELQDIQNQESTNKLNEALVRVEGSLSLLEKKEHADKIKHMDLDTLFKKINTDKEEQNKITPGVKKTKSIGKVKNKKEPKKPGKKAKKQTQNKKK